MQNLFYLIGRLTDDVKVIETEEGKKHSYITVAVQRSYKNAEGIYESDFIDVNLWNGIAQNVAEYCKRGDLIGIKGRIEETSYEKDGETIHKTNLVADKISFLSATKTKTNDDKEIE